jgi:hypothetical protein
MVAIPDSSQHYWKKLLVALARFLGLVSGETSPQISDFSLFKAHFPKDSSLFESDSSMFESDWSLFESDSSLF